MTDFFYPKKSNWMRKTTSSFVALAFLLSLIFGPATGVNAQYISNLPKPGEMVLLSPAFQPPVLKGMTLHPENPLQFDFIVDRGQDKLSGDALKGETQKLLKYFLAAMTIPDNDSWVNLSPYEGDRIIPDMLGSTDMGKQMLEQDYLLKQLSASLTNPQEEIGKKFWDTVYKKAYEKFGTTSIPINTFNKVWIVPDRALILEEDGYVFIGESHLKVMLDEDYTSLKENLKSEKFHTKGISQDKVEALSEVSSEVVRQVILPELEKEINEGKNFAAVRQIYHSVILATWYKQNLKNSLLGKIYVDKSKIAGVNIGEKDLKQKVYEQYLAAFRKGVYNLIKEDYDLASKETLPRKYFSGGLNFLLAGESITTIKLAAGRDSLDLAQASAQRAGYKLNPIIAGLRDSIGDSRFASASVIAAEGDEAPKVAAIAQTRASSPSSVGKPPRYVEILKRVLTERDMDPESAAYFVSLVRAFFNPTEDQQPLIIKIPGVSFGNFRPSALLTPQERRDLLGQITYGQLLEEISSTSGQYVYDVVLSSLDAGLGTNVGRQDFVQSKLGRNRIGAKGTDLGVEGIKPRGILNIAEIKLLRLIKEVESGVYPVKAGGQIVFQPIVSVDSKPSYDALFNEQFFNPFGQQQTYRQKLEGLGVVIRPRIVPFYPGLSTENGNYPTWGRESSGSHGEVGFKILLETLDMKIQDKPLYNVFFNGDGVNNMADHYMLDWMAKNNVPMVMVSTAKIPFDKKGGQIGLEFLPDGHVHIKMLELKSAQNNQQGFEFERVGLEGGIGEVGRQDFNTNVAIINQALLAKILQDVLREVFDGDVSKMQQIFTPDLIASEKPNEKGEMFIQLEGPIGTVLTNVHNFFASNNDPKVREILKRHNVDRMLRIVHVEANNRTKVFTPIKSALDFVLQMYSDYYRLNRDIWMLENARPGSILPVINLVGSNSKDKYYEDVSHLINTFGKFSVTNLKELNIHGRVVMQNAVFEGKVRIDNKFGQIVDLSMFKGWIGSTKDGRLLFQDVAIEITEGGEFFKKEIASSSLKEVDIEVAGEGEEISSVKPLASSSVGQALTSQEIDQHKSVAPWDFETAGDVRGSTLVRDGAQELDTLYQKNYFENQIQLRHDIIEVLVKYFKNKTIDKSELKESLNKLHNVLIRGYGGQSGFTLTSEGYHSRNTQAISQYIDSMAKNITTFVNTDFQTKSFEEKAEFIAKFHAELAKLDNVFSAANYSFHMAWINGMLALSGLQGIEHQDWDKELLAVKKGLHRDWRKEDLDQFTVEVEKEVVAAIKRANDAQAQVGASVAASPVGGIDFDPTLLNLQIKRNGRGVPLPLPEQNLENINIDGLYPVIINMQPATIQNFPFLISADKNEKVPELSMR